MPPVSGPALALDADRQHRPEAAHRPHSERESSPEVQTAAQGLAGRLPGQEGHAALSANVHSIFGNSLMQAALAGTSQGPGEIIQGAMALGAGGVAVSGDVGGLFSNSFVQGWMGASASAGVAAGGAVLARHEDAPGGGAWDRGSVSAVNTATRRGGRALPTGLASQLGAAFGGVDFSHVRIHTDGAAVRASDAINARAFTVGSAIYFNQGEFSPHSPEGQHLLAHELTHVVQHMEGRLRPRGDRGEGMNVSSPHDATEVEAESRAAQVVTELSRPGGPSLDAAPLSLESEAPAVEAPAVEASAPTSAPAAEQGAVLSRDRDDDKVTGGNTPAGTTHDPAQAATPGNIKIDSVVFHDDQRPTQTMTALSAQRPKADEDGVSDVFVWGTFRAVGPKTESISDVRLDIVQGGRKVATGSLYDGRRADIIGKSFSSGAKNPRDKSTGVLSQQAKTFKGKSGTPEQKMSSTMPLFRIPPAELDKIDVSKNDKLTLRLVITSSSGLESTYEHPQPMTLLARYPSDDQHSRYPGIDPEEGGDHWIQPAARDALKHYQAKIPGLSVGDLSNMNAGDTPDHQTHETGMSADVKWWPAGDLPTTMAEEAVTILLRDILADSTYGASVQRIYATREGTYIGKAIAKVVKANPAWKSHAERIVHASNHLNHFHIDFKPNTAPATAPATGGPVAGGPAGPTPPPNMRPEVGQPVRLEEDSTAHTHDGPTPTRHRRANGFMARDAMPRLPKPQGGGRPLPQRVGSTLGGMLGQGTQDVRVHTGPQANAFAAAHRAEAVTEGQDVFFGRGRFNPSSAPGIDLLAEEVHHAVRGGGRPGVTQPGDPHERQARGFAGAAQGMLGQANGMLGQASGLLGQASGVAGQVQGIAGQVGSAIPGLEGAANAVSGVAGQAQGVIGQAQGAIGQAQDFVSNPMQAVARMAGGEAAPAIEGQLAARFGVATAGDAAGAIGAPAAVTAGAEGGAVAPATESATPTQAPTAPSGGGGSTSSATGSGSGGGGLSTGGAGGATGGGGDAPAAAPTPVAAGATAKESFENFTSAGATTQAASWPMLGGNVDQGWQQEATAINEALPDLSASLSGELSAPDAAGDGTVAPQTAEIDTPAAGTPPPTAPVTSSMQPRYTGNRGAGATVASLPDTASDQQKAQAARSAIAGISTRDGAVATTVTPKPQITLTGDYDPNQTREQVAQGAAQAEAARAEAERAIRTGPGPEQVVPKALDEAMPVQELSAGAIEATAQLPDFEEYLSLGLPADVQSTFDQAMQADIDAALGDAKSQFTTAESQRDSGQQSEIDRATQEVDQANQAAQREQESEVRAARATIEGEQQATIQAQQAELGKLDADAKKRQSADISAINRRVAADSATINAEFSKAERDAKAEVKNAETQAASEKAKAEKEADKSWWQKAVDFVADAVRSVAAAITRIFDAVRETVAAILDTVKNLANSLIDAACSFVKNAIKAFGEYLKGLVDNLLGAVFPGLAAALKGFIDDAVDAACAVVDHVADRLKKTIADACDAINNALQAISDAFQAAVDTVLAIAEAALTGNWQELLWKVLEAALKLCGINPEEFRGVMAQGEETIDVIVHHPGQFIGNMIDAVGLGFTQFKDNFWTHLQSGFVGWLTGQAGDAGITIPQTFDAAGIISLVMQVTGITPTYMEEKARKHLGDENVDRIQFVMGWIQAAMGGGSGEGEAGAEGAALAGGGGGMEGITAHLNEHIDGIYDEFVGKVQTFLMEKIVIAAVTKIATMFNPVGAIVQAVLTAWKVYEFLRDQISRIYAVVQSVIGSVHAIATGAIQGAASQVEGALANLIPVAIDLLAKLIGVSGVGKKVRETLTALHEKIDAGIEKLIGKVKGMFKPKDKKKPGEATGSSAQTEPGAQTGAVDPNNPAATAASQTPGTGNATADSQTAAGGDVDTILAAKQGFTAGPEQHHTWVASNGGSFVPMVASTPTPADQLLADWRAKAGTIADAGAKDQLLKAVGKGEKAIVHLNNALTVLKGMPTKDATEREARAKQARKCVGIESSIHGHLAIGFQTFGQTPGAVNVDPKSTTNTPEFQSFQKKFNDLCAELKMAPPAGEAERIWIQVFWAVVGSEGAYQAQVPMATANPGEYRKDLAHRTMEGVMAKFNPVISSLQPYLSGQLKIRQTGTWAFWGKDPAKDLAVHHGNFALEGSALGSCFDGINILGKWDIQLWSSISRAFANAAAEDVLNRKYLVFCGPNSGGGINIWSMIESKVLNALGAAQKATPQITYYAAAAKLTPQAGVDGKADYNQSGGGLAGTIASDPANRDAMSQKATDYFTQILDAATKPGGTPPAGSTPTNGTSAPTSTNTAPVDPATSTRTEPPAGTNEKSKHSAGAPPTGWSAQVVGAVPSASVRADDPGHTYHLLSDGSGVSTSDPQKLKSDVAGDLKKKVKPTDQTGKDKDESETVSSTTPGTDNGGLDERAKALKPLHSRLLKQAHDLPDKVSATKWEAIARLEASNLVDDIEVLSDYAQSSTAATDLAALAGEITGAERELSAVKAILDQAAKSGGTATADGSVWEQRLAKATPAVYEKHIKARTDSEAKEYSQDGGHAQYLPAEKANRHDVELEALRHGTVIKGDITDPNGTVHVSYDVGRPIGYFDGTLVNTMRAEICSGNEYHGHPRPY